MKYIIHCIFICERFFCFFFFFAYKIWTKYKWITFGIWNICTTVYGEIIYDFVIFSMANFSNHIWIKILEELNSWNRFWGISHLFVEIEFDDCKLNSLLDQSMYMRLTSFEYRRNIAHKETKKLRFHGWGFIFLKINQHFDI